MSKAPNYFERHRNTFPVSIFWIARYRFFAAVTLTMTMKQNRDLDILKTIQKTSLYTENELLGQTFENSSQYQVKVKCHQLSTTSSVPHGAYSHKETSITGQ